MPRTVPPVPLEVFQLAHKTFEITVNDADGNPVDLTGKTLRFVAHNTADPTAAVFKITATISGDDNEIANVPITPTETATARDDLVWKLWSIADDSKDLVWSYGTLRIRPAQKDTA